METNEGNYPNAIKISRRTEKGVYGSQEITLTLDTAIKFRNFLNNIVLIDTSNKSSFSCDIDDVTEKSNTEKRLLLQKEFLLFLKIEKMELLMN